MEIVYRTKEEEVIPLGVDTRGEEEIYSQEQLEQEPSPTKNLILLNS
ncbi:MAG: hypothetical protein IPK55_10820 [Streptococcus sp.]|nr:hypothetical protein [Streptococcus sp.]